MNFRGISIMAAAAAMLSCASGIYKTDTIGIEVSPQENREYSYTDKKAGYWYGRTHMESLDWYSGWNMAKKRILADYTIGADGVALKKSDAACTVFPDRLVRKWDNAVETFQLLDDMPAIIIDLDTDADSIFCVLDTSLLKDQEATAEGLLVTPHEAPDSRILLTPLSKSGFEAMPYGIKAPASAGGFILTYGTAAECSSLAAAVRSDLQSLVTKRKDRINGLITEYNPVKSNLPELDKALDWITITMDELITEQQDNLPALK